MHEQDLDGERRHTERRRDVRTEKLLAQGTRLQATLGFETAMRHLLAEGVSESLARAVLFIRFERRERSRRKRAQLPEATATNRP